MNKGSNQIQKLPQEVVNQIAAGEVVERPSSVIKELIDNSIDAGSTKIEIRIKDGGRKLIEIVDNGVGIPRSEIINAFEAHTTSKLTSIEDLNDLITMGFRGEALSTIVSVSNLTVVSKVESENSATKVEFSGITPSEVTDAAREVGTTMSVADIFSNIPARQKYLRSPETEYRYILKMLIPYFLNFPHIHFVFKKDGKEVYNLPATSARDSGLNESRIKDVLKSDFTEDLVSIYYEGNGIKISGFVASPIHHRKRLSHTYLFVNGRPVTDFGINKSIAVGFGSYIPHGEKIPFIINLDLPFTMVDINVHPRKEEVKFLNPYRIYSAVEQAVSKALKNEYSGSVNPEVTGRTSSNDVAYSRLRNDSDNSSSSGISYSNDLRSGSGGGGGRDYSRQPQASVQFSLEFSRMLLDNDSSSEMVQHNLLSSEEEGAYSKMPTFNTISQVFKKYIIAEQEDELWIIDQHAAAERITFERLQHNYINSEPEVQNLLLPKIVMISTEEASFYEEQQDFFRKLGFEYLIDGTQLSMSCVPVEFAESDINKIFIDLGGDELDVRDSAFDLVKQTDDVLATIACHNSIRANHRLNQAESLSIIQQLLLCKNPYSCPHGRPIVWKQSISELDSHFERTY